mmetsp:Transcript_50727/g.110080  ORF Transcript_50727/g.110080 Transcript_50727/m.110080 type:complete len:85 (-) Transcript_50727:42-296(-)
MKLTSVALPSLHLELEHLLMSLTLCKNWDERDVATKPVIHPTSQGLLFSEASQQAKAAKSRKQLSLGSIRREKPALSAPMCRSA